MHLVEETHSPKALSRSQSSGYYQNRRTAQHMCVATRFSHTFCQHRRLHNRLYLDPEKERPCVFVVGERTKMSLFYSIVFGIGRKKMEIFTFTISRPQPSWIRVGEWAGRNSLATHRSCFYKKMAKWPCFNYQAPNRTLVPGAFTNKGPHHGVYCRQGQMAKWALLLLLGFLVPHCTCFKPFTT